MSEAVKRWKDKWNRKLFPHPSDQKVVQRAKDVEATRLEAIAHFDWIANKLRVHGDFWLAEEVERFRKEYFGEAETK